MKKSILICFLFLAGLCASAQTMYREHVADAAIERGDYLFGIHLGGGFPSGDSGESLPLLDDKSNLDWGKSGIVYGVSMMGFVHRYFGVGAEFSGFNTRESDFESGYNGGAGHAKVKTSMAVYNVSLAARLNLNPQHDMRVYVPFGFGRTKARLRGKLKADVAGDEITTEDVLSSCSWAYFVGLGIEHNLGHSGGLVGIEGRYTNFGFRGERLHYYSALLKLGYRF